VHRPHPQIPLKHPHFSPSVCSAWDKGYKYGFNSMEKDNEINVNGGSYDFGARIYDSRLGRWLSLDNSAFNYPSSSPYSSVDNSPILNIDFDGNDFIVSTTKDASGKIILTVSSTIYCVGASPMMIAEMNNIFKQIYKDYESNGIVVKFNVSFVEMKQDLIKTVMKGTESVNKDWNGNNGNNVMYFGVKSDGNKSRVPGTRIKTTNVSFINNSIRLENQIVEAVHEAGHLLGLSDRYDKIIKNDSPNETIPHKGFENDLFGSYGGSKIHDIHYRGYIHSFDKLIKEAMSGNIVNKEYSRTMVEVEEVNKGNGSKGIKFKEEWQPTTLNHTEPKEELDPERFRGKVLVGNTYVNRQRQ
jgi:RHS repeat-associated protein